MLKDKNEKNIIKKIKNIYMLLLMNSNILGGE
jgi:hypothetical protein